MIGAFDFGNFAKEVLLDSLIDSLKVLAVVFFIYVLIEFIEDKISGFFIKHPKKTGLIAVPLAIIPQCGFSVVCTDLFSRRKLSIGCLVGVYIATSDEAIPIMLSHPDKIVDCLILVGVKLLVGIMAVVIIDFVVEKLLKIEDVKESDEAEHTEIVGCCGHHIEVENEEKTEEKIDKKVFFKEHFLHPFLHSLKIFLYVLIVNVLFGTLVYFVGEQEIERFLTSNVYLSPILALVVGLIPNCASSVIITNLYVEGALSFGACVAGLSANAGLGLMYLFRNVKEVKRNVAVVSLLIFISLLAGYATLLVELNV